MFSAATKSNQVASAANYVEEVFSTYLYTGNGATQTITNGIDLAGKGGLVWIKGRSNATNNLLADTNQGATKWLDSAFTDATHTTAQTLTSFNSNGFSLGNDYYVNYSSSFTYVSWTFRKQPKFFDVVTYTGNGTAGRTIAHSLGSVPGCIIVKCTSNADVWPVYHQDVGNTKYTRLDSTAAPITSLYVWNNTSPTSTVFTVGDDSSVNQSGYTYVAYIFAHNAGGFGLTGTDNVISCGSVTFSSGINTINLGYEPQWVLFKPANTTGNWQLVDNMRGFSQTGYARLFPNLSDAEGTVNSPYIAPTATGFTMDAGVYGAGNTYIYIAIRRGPMKVPTDATKVFQAGQNTTSIANQVNGTVGAIDITMQTQVPTPIAGYHFTTFDRLRGQSYLATAYTNGETGGLVYFDTNVGVRNGSWFSSGGLWYNFQRAPNFCDVVCYTGTGSATTFNHNLTVVPELIIFKRRNTAAAWGVYCNQYNGGANANQYYQLLNQPDAASSGSGLLNNTNPTASVFTVGTWNENNASGSTYAAYLFATCAGVSKVGSYTGTGTLTTINCGFTGGARFVLIKRTDSTSDWYVWNTVSGMVAGTDPSLSFNTPSAQANANSVYTATTGFQLLASPSADVNTSGGTYIYLAIA